MRRERVHVDREHERFAETYVPPAGEPVVAALAPHGGGIEPATDEQALALRERLGDGAGAWVCRGAVDGGGAFDRWHVTATALSRDAFAFLGDVLDGGYRHAVAFHGLGPDEDALLVGGLADRRLRAALRDELDGRLPVDVAVSERGPYAGVDPENVVNRVAAAGGLQIEQPPGVRDDHADAVVDGVAAVLSASR